MAPTMFQKLVLATGGLVLGIVVLEFGLRANDFFRGRGLATHGNLLAEPMQTLIPFRTFGFDPYATAEDGERIISSRRGELYRFQKPEGTFRIVSFGGSTTENLSHEVHYPLQLQTILRERLGTDAIEVINVGNAAYSTAHSISMLALDVVSWEPDLVILSHNLNDLLVAYWPGFRPDYWNKYADEYYMTPDYSERYSWTNVLLQHSRLYWFVKEGLDRLQNPQILRTDEIRRKSYGSSLDPEVAAVFERNLMTFVGIAKTHGFDVILGSQPLEPSEAAFVTHMRHKPYNHTVIYPEQDEFVEHHGQFNRIIEDVARKTGVGFVDNAANMSGESEYFIDFVHYDAAGIDALADNYANSILETSAGRFEELARSEPTR